MVQHTEEDKEKGCPIGDNPHLKAQWEGSSGIIVNIIKNQG